MAYSQDLKRRVLAFAAAAGSKVEAARLFSLAPSTLHVWLGQPPDHPRGKPGPKTGHKIDRAKLAQLIQEQPGLLQREMAHIMGVSPTGIWHALQAMKITCKKTLRYAQAFTPAGALQRKKYLLRHWRQQLRGRTLVYLDETGFVASTHRTHGWARRGHKAHGLQNAQQRPRTRLIGGYREHKLMVPMLFEGACNTEVFNQWIEHMLLPQLASGSTIVLDNASFHKSEHTRRLVEHAGCQLLYLPPYSPDLNPIEKLWANLKGRWRKVGGTLEEMIVGSDYLLD
jgi:transposase/transposase-like protein